MKKLFWWFSAFIALSLLLAACGAPPTAATPAPAQTATPKPKSEGATAPAVPTKTTTQSPAQAATQAAKPGEPPYYAGKTIEVTVDSAAGGGTDTIARITTPVLSKYIPGNPNIIIRNTPGGGGSVGTNIFQEKTKPDGLKLLQHGSGVLSMQLASRDVIKYDLTKNRYIGNVSRAESVVIIKKGLKDRLTDASAPPLRVGTKEGQETWQAILMYGKEFLGWNVRWVVGYGGTSEMELAFRRGELDIFATSNAFIVQRMTQQEGLADTMGMVGSLKGGKFVRRPDFPEVPTFEEMLGNKKPTGLPWQAFLSWVGPTAVDKALAAPPKTPDNVMAVLTDAFAKTERDPEYNVMLKKLVSEVYDIGVGKETDDLMKQVLDVPQEAITYTHDMQVRFGILSK